jgi:hypothetical protein
MLPLVIVGHFEPRRSVVLMWRAVRNKFCVKVAPGSSWGHAHTCDKLIVSLRAGLLQCDIQYCAHLMCQQKDIAVRTAITLLCAYREIAGVI